MVDRSRRYVFLIAAGGALSAAGAAVWLPAVPTQVRSFVVLTMLAIVAAVVPVRFQHRGGTQGFTLEGGIFVALLFSAPLGSVPVLLLLSSLGAHVARGSEFRKAAFNAGRTGLESTAGVIVFSLLAPGAPAVSQGQSVLAAVAASLTFELVSIVAMTELFHRLDGERRRRLVDDVARVSAITYAANTTFGLILAAVVLVSDLVALLAGVLMLGIYLGYRGHAGAVAAQKRAEALNEITHSLLDLPGNERAIGEALARLVQVFGGMAAEIQIAFPHGVRHWVFSGDDIRIDEMDELPREGHLAAALASRDGVVVHDRDGLPHGTRTALVSPVGRADRLVGIVAIYGRRGLEPWDGSDVALLSAIGNELAVALENADLFQQVEEERLRLESESTKLGDILGAASDGIVLVGRDADIQSWNPGMERITGVPASDAVGHPWYVVLRLRDETGADLLPAGGHVLSRSLEGDRSETPVSLQALRRDGDWRWLQCTVAPIAPHGDEPGGIVLVARDVTAERELDALKADFISTVSHELRTPLTPLKGFLSTMRQRSGNLTPEQLLSVNDAMSTQVTRLETLIADLLAVAELEHGRFDVHAESVDLAESVPVAVEVECSATGGASDRCRIVVREPVMAVADPVALVRSVRALVSNAIKHTEGTIEVTIGGDEEWAYVAVRDEGPGIPAWDQQRIFGRFERLGDHLRRTQGPGLGLTIARSLAHRMGGEITLESDVAGGSTFTLQLPRARPRPVVQGLARQA